MGALKVGPYRMTQEGMNQLDQYAAGIIANPGKMIDPRTFDEIEARVDLARIVPGLRDTILYEDYINALRLALLTECATTSYDIQFQAVAKNHTAPWLAAFNERVWSPDEETHRTPYLRTLIAMGCDPSELAREMKEAQERPFDRGVIDDPVIITMFGTNQEFVTDVYHGAVAFTTKPFAPLAAHGIFLVKKREKLHTEWYRKMTAIQIQAVPELLVHAAFSTAHFEMPENQVAPHLAPYGGGYLKQMGVDSQKLARGLFRIFYQLTDDVNKTGQYLLDVGAEKGMSVKGINVRYIRWLMSHLHQTGFIGEVMLQAVGLNYLFQKEELQSLRGRVRALLRDFFARRLELGMINA